MEKKFIPAIKDRTVNSLTAHPFLEKETKPQISFSIRAEGKMYFVLVENIAFIHVEGETVYLIDFNGDKHVISKTLGSLEKAISAQQFYRINRQMLVNRQAIKDVESYPNQRIVVHLTVPTTEITIVPRLKVRPFLNWIERG
jgi:DNA-binding LytR/AlgR family response regulator